MQLQKASEQFCRSILNLGTIMPKGLSSLIMSLSSNRFGKSVVGLSENPLYQHSYSSISQVVSTLSLDESSHNSVQTSLQDKNKVGATTIYGETTYYLQLTSGNHVSKNGKTKESSTKYRDAIYDLEAHETLEIKETTSKGRSVIVLIKM